jgi:hypothetical protein
MNRRHANAKLSAAAPRTQDRPKQRGLTPKYGLVAALPLPADLGSSIRSGRTWLDARGAGQRRKPRPDPCLTHTFAASSGCGRSILSTVSERNEVAVSRAAAGMGTKEKASRTPAVPLWRTLPRASSRVSAGSTPDRYGLTPRTGWVAGEHVRADSPLQALSGCGVPFTDAGLATPHDRIAPRRASMDGIRPGRRSRIILLPDAAPIGGRIPEAAWRGRL